MIQCLFLHTKFLSTLPWKQANPHPIVVWLQHYSRALDIQVATSTYSYLFPSLKKAQIKPSLAGDQSDTADKEGQEQDVLPTLLLRESRKKKRDGGQGHSRG